MLYSFLSKRLLALPILGLSLALPVGRRSRPTRGRGQPFVAQLGGHAAFTADNPSVPGESAPSRSLYPANIPSVPILPTASY
jgi:hypothetical protein